MSQGRLLFIQNLLFRILPRLFKVLSVFAIIVYIEMQMHGNYVLTQSMFTARIVIKIITHCVIDTIVGAESEWVEMCKTHSNRVSSFFIVVVSFIICPMWQGNVLIVVDLNAFTLFIFMERWMCSYDVGNIIVEMKRHRETPMRNWLIYSWQYDGNKLFNKIERNDKTWAWQKKIKQKEIQANPYKQIHTKLDRYMVSVTGHTNVSFHKMWSLPLSSSI